MIFFFPNVFILHEGLLHSQSCFCALQDTRDFFRSSELLVIKLLSEVFFPDHSVLRLFH